MGGRNGEGDYRSWSATPARKQKRRRSHWYSTCRDFRIFVLNSIPLPTDPGLKQLVEETELITDKTSGITFGHGIVLKNGAIDRRLVAHELVHVMQYEKFGGIEAFLKEYVKEVAFPPGYPHGPLEREAAQVADRVCQKP
jgi:hypothetical protein